MGNTIKSFTKQATYSSESSSGSTNRSDGGGISVGNAELHRNDSHTHSFVFVGGGPTEVISPPDSGRFSAEASTSIVSAPIQEARQEGEEEKEEVVVMEEVGEVEEEVVVMDEEEVVVEGGETAGPSCPVFQVTGRPRQPVEHSPSSSPVSPPSSPSGPSPSSSDSADSGDGRSSTSSTSSQVVRTPIQESCWMNQRSVLQLERWKMLVEILKKKCVSHSKVLKIPIPTCAQQCFARLTYNFVSYVQEDTDWPDRFSRMSFHLDIPKKCVEALTVSHRCTVVITVSVGSSSTTGRNNDLLDGRRALTLRRVVTPGETSMDLFDACKVVCHTALLDASCVNFCVTVFANFDLRQLKYNVNENGEVTMTEV